MSKTPRTDAVAWSEWVPGKTQESTIIALFSFARELELELAAKDAECKELKANLDRYIRRDSLENRRDFYINKDSDSKP